MGGLIANWLSWQVPLHGPYLISLILSPRLWPSAYPIYGGIVSWIEIIFFSPVIAAIGHAQWCAMGMQRHNDMWVIMGIWMEKILK